LSNEKTQWYKVIAFHRLFYKYYFKLYGKVSEATGVRIQQAPTFVETAL